MIEMVAGAAATLGAGCVGLVVLGAVGFGVWRAFFKLSPNEQAERRDRARDPRYGWVQGVMFPVTYTQDMANWKREKVASMMATWEIADLAALDAHVARAMGRSTHPAWDAARGMMLYRQAVALGWLDSDASFARCLPLGTTLQARYGDWFAMGDDLLAGALDEMGPEAHATMKEDAGFVRDSHWKKIAWRMPLA